MAPCSPSTNNLHPPVVPGIPIPGFGIPFSPIQLPIPGFKLPEGFPEKVLEILNALKINWPGGILNPQIDNFAATLLNGIMNLFSMLSPFLSMYSFITALLNMILCIIDVLCAIPNPYKLIKAVRKLIKECLPPFLNLFPWLALIAMILSIILLLIALISYIIARILELINDILENLELLGKCVTSQDAEATAAIAFKLASLLCIIENLMAMLSAIAVIMAIIEALSQLGGVGICSSGRDGEEDSGCCGDDVCPPFIRNNPNGIQGIQGKLIYYKQIIDPSVVDNPMFSSIFGDKITGNTLRREWWQFVNDDPEQPYSFKDIITQYQDTTTQRNADGGSRSNSSDFEYGDIFWPDGQTYSATTSLRKAPYTVNLTFIDLNVDEFDNGDNSGTRTVIVKNAIVESKPYIGVRDETGAIQQVDNLYGTLSLVGGLAYEADGITPITSNGVQLTIENLIHYNYGEAGSVPSFDDGYYFNDIIFTLNINHASLLGYNLITLGCTPDISIETTRLNDELASSFDPVITRVGAMPDIARAQECVANVIKKLRDDISPDNVRAAQTDMIACLEQLKTEAEDTFCRALFAGADVYGSTFSIEPDLQFISEKIKVSVVLKDKAGVVLSDNIPDSCSGAAADALSGEVSLGELSKFTYNKDISVFEAYISSDEGGDGELRISWQNNMFLEKLNTDNPDIDTATQERFLPYTFVSSVKGIAGGVDVGKVRRDATDVANNVSEV